MADERRQSVSQSFNGPTFHHDEFYRADHNWSSDNAKSQQQQATSSSGYSNLGSGSYNAAPAHSNIPIYAQPSRASIVGGNRQSLTRLPTLSGLSGLTVSGRSGSVLYSGTSALNLSGSSSIPEDNLSSLDRHAIQKNAALHDAAKRAYDFERKSILVARAIKSNDQSIGAGDMPHDANRAAFHLGIYGADPTAPVPAKPKIDIETVHKHLSQLARTNSQIQLTNSGTIHITQYPASGLTLRGGGKGSVGGLPVAGDTGPKTNNRFALTDLVKAIASTTNAIQDPDAKEEQQTIELIKRASTRNVQLDFSADKKPTFGGGIPPINEKDLDITDVEGVEPELLKTDMRVGLTEAEVASRLERFGFNELPEKKTNPWLKFLSYFTGSIAYLIEAACILSAILRDWTDFGIILALLLINACIGYFEEAKAENAINALRSTLALNTKAVRNGKLEEVPSRLVVPGDIVSLRIGDVVPADCKLLGVNASYEPASEVSIDQSALTGESLPVNKNRGDLAYSGTIVKQGQQMALVTLTAEKTFLGRAAHLIAITEDSGHFQKVITQIGNFLIAITIILVVVILIVGTVAYGKSFLDELHFALVLTIASIPVGLPTVLSVTLAVGAKQLSERQVIVKRLTAIEEMAGIDILCSDKTGTLTLNQLTLDDPFLNPGFTNNDLLMTSYLASESGANDAIELCVRKYAADTVPDLKGVDQTTSVIPGHRIIQFQPFDPVSKLTRATVHRLSDDTVFCVAKGAPHVIIRLAAGEDNRAAQKAIVTMASRGLRALGVARSKPIRLESGQSAPLSDTVQWQLVGLLSLLDPPRPDSKHTIEQCNFYGISVKMITGDAQLIAKEVAKRLGMFQCIMNPSKLSDKNASEEDIIKCCVKADGFAQVVPEDKFRVVELLQSGGHLVGMTGDGVNDAPALKKANVGIAVHGCTDAARSAADIVLLQPGLSTIVDGIITSRIIFQRMRSYAVYRITSTVHFLAFLFCTIIIYDYSLPADLIVLIALLNDGATIVISIDNALVSPRPDKWRLGQLLTLSVVLGFLLAGSSFAHFFVARDFFLVSRDELDTILYLQMSSCPHFVIFSTRLAVPFWHNAPSLLFFIAIVGTQIFAMYISIYGLLAHPIGWAWGASVMAISVGYFIILDQVKVQIYKIWSFELTATLWPVRSRREKLKARRAQKIRLARIKINIRKAKKIINAVRFAYHLPHFRKLPDVEFVPPPSHH